MYTILYPRNGVIYSEGSFCSEIEALKGVKKAHEAKIFDIVEDNVYIVTPMHSLNIVCMEDLNNLEDSETEDFNSFNSEEN